jgi:hypothetical protein
MLTAWPGTLPRARACLGLLSHGAEPRSGPGRTEADWDEFFERYGHRSFSLDIFRPTFAEQGKSSRLAAGMDEDDLEACPTVRQASGPWRGHL